MNTPNRRKDADVDNILKELKGKGALPKSGDSELDDILSDLKKGTLVHKPPAPTPKTTAEPPTPEPPPVPPVEPVLAPPEQVVALKSETPVKEFDVIDATRTISLSEEERKAYHEPRVGKASALSKVERDKYVGDTELTSWFSQEDPKAKKQAMRQAQKEEKKKKAAEKKEKRKRQKEEPPAFMEPQPQPVPPVQVVQPPEPAAEPETPPQPPAQAPAEQVVPPPPVESKEAEPIIESSGDTQVAVPTQKTARPTPSNAETQVAIPIPSSRDREKARKARLSPAKSIALTQVVPLNLGDEGGDTKEVPAAKMPSPKEGGDTKEVVPEPGRVPTAAYTQEFDDKAGPQQRFEIEGSKNLFVDDMVDDRFRDFFSETVSVGREEVEQGAKKRREKKRRKKKKHPDTKGTDIAQGIDIALEIDTPRPEIVIGKTEGIDIALAGEDEASDPEEEWDDYNRPQDADMVLQDLVSMRASLTRRSIISGVVSIFLVWMGLDLIELLPLPTVISSAENSLIFAILYMVLLAGCVVLNFTTVSSGLGGLVGESTVDTPPALAAVAALLQGVVLLVQLVTKQSVMVTAFGGLAVLLLAINALGKRLRATTIIENFKLVSAGVEHSAAYVLADGQEVVYDITKGLNENDPALLVSRPTALVKGFIRQSFSSRWSDRWGRIFGWILVGTGLACGIISYVLTKDLMGAITSFAAAFCIGAPLSSTLVFAVPSKLLQRGTAKVGAVVPGWSAIQELGKVNVVMGGAKDLFPPVSVQLKGIKTFQRERVDLAILYAASVLTEGCDTLRDIFLAVIQGKNDILYQVENLMIEPGRGFTAWVENNRVIIGNREMLEKYDIPVPSQEMEDKYVGDENLPVYLAVSGKLFAMFIVHYGLNMEVRETLVGLIKSGVSMLIISQDMNVDDQLIEHVYHLPPGVIKVLGRRELEMLEPLRAYLPESEGVMTHIGSFSSFIGGMRAAAGCAASEKMSGIVQIVSVVLAALLCLLLVVSGGLANISIYVAILYQIGWTVLICALPFTRRY